MLTDNEYIEVIPGIEQLHTANFEAEEGFIIMEKRCKMNEKWKVDIVKPL